MMETKGSPKTKQSNSDRLISRRARLGLLVMNVSLAAALVASAIIGYLDAKETFTAVIRARSFDILSSIRRSLRTMGVPSSESVKELLNDLAPHGLFYLAVTNRQGKFPIQVGEAHQKLPERKSMLSIEGDPLISVSEDASAVQVMDLLKPKAPRRKFLKKTFSREFNRFRARHPHRRRKYHRRWRSWKRPTEHYLVIEFEPVVASSIKGRASTNLILSLASACLLLAGTLLFWRQGEREERYIAQLNRDEQLKQLGEMSAILGHEIRNPLASLKGHAQLLQEKLGNADERILRKSELVVEEAKRIERLTHQILDFAKKKEIQRRSCDPREILRRACHEVSDERVVLELPGTCSSYLLDENRLVQVMVNLLRNALDVSGERASVLAGLEVLQNDLVFSVRDEGPGIEEDELEELFTPFHGDRIHGTGLGLTIAKRIVEEHSGRIDGANRNEGGAVFKVIIPNKG